MSRPLCIQLCAVNRGVIGKSDHQGLTASCTFTGASRTRTPTHAGTHTRTRTRTHACTQLRTLARTHHTSRMACMARIRNTEHDFLVGLTPSTSNMPYRDVGLGNPCGKAAPGRFSDKCSSNPKTASELPQSRILTPLVPQNLRAQGAALAWRDARSVDNSQASTCYPLVLPRPL